MKKIIALALVAFTFLPTSISAQDEIKATVSADLVSRYMWRGSDLADVSLQPTLNVGWKGLELELFGSTPLEKDGGAQEIDVSLGYSLFGVNIGVTDYWTANVDSENRYFHFGGKTQCPHQLEANIGYTCKYGSLQAYTIFWGNDYKKNGDRAYSTYIELSVPFRLGGLDWDVRAGITPMESGCSSYKEEVETSVGSYTIDHYDWMYGERFNCNMASVRATKTLEFKHFNVPVFVEVHTNPYLQRANFVLGVSITTL